MNNNYSLSKKDKTRPLFMAVLLSQLGMMFPMLMSILNIHRFQIVSFVIYALMTTASFILLRYTTKTHLKLDFIQKCFFLWLFLLYVFAIPDIFNPYSGYLSVKQFLTYIMFLYAIPLFMIAEIDLGFLNKTFRFVYILLVINLILDVLLAGYKNEGYTVFAEGAIILLFTFPYHSSRKKAIIVLTIGLVLIGMLLSARRNKVVYYGGAFLFSFITILFSNSNLNVSRKIAYLIILLLFSVGLYIFIDRFAYFFERVNTGMLSRESIIELFIEDFNSTPSDWVWGRGLYGSFNGGVLNTDADMELRDGIENGYLFLILKGGGIWLGLLTLISLKAAYKGIFKSQNLLCKGFAMIILLYYVDMIGFGIPQTSMKYIMVFISIAGCNTEWLRQIPDSQLSKEIGLK